MENKIKEILGNILKAFNNNAEGYSLKKIMVFISLLIGFLTPIVLWAIDSYKTNKWEQISGVLAVVAGLITSLFVANVYQVTKTNTSNNGSN